MIINRIDYSDDVIAHYAITPAHGGLLPNFKPTTA